MEELYADVINTVGDEESRKDVDRIVEVGQKNYNTESDWWGQKDNS